MPAKAKQLCEDVRAGRCINPAAVQTRFGISNDDAKRLWYEYRPRYMAWNLLHLPPRSDFE
jgi:hypothetical protein